MINKQQEEYEQRKQKRQELEGKQQGERKLLYVLSYIRTQGADSL